MNIISLIIEAISGAVGGNMAGAAMKDNIWERWEIPSPELSVVAWAERSSKLATRVIDLNCVFALGSRRERDDLKNRLNESKAS